MYPFLICLTSDYLNRLGNGYAEIKLTSYIYLTITSLTSRVVMFRGSILTIFTAKVLPSSK